MDMGAHGVAWADSTGQRRSWPVWGWLQIIAIVAVASVPSLLSFSGKPEHTGPSRDATGQLEIFVQAAFKACDVLAITYYCAMGAALL